MKKYLHTFVICAYKESVYLEECIESLLAQTVKSKIIMVTSTPSLFLDAMSRKYDIELFVNEGESGITQDWNFGLSHVSTKLATIAHQDDVYEPTYVEEFVKAIRHTKRPIIAFSDYGEIRNGEKTTDVSMLKIKRLMMLPLRLRFLKGSRFVRRRVLSMGDPICCPSVMFAMGNVEQRTGRLGRSCPVRRATSSTSRSRLCITVFMRSRRLRRLLRRVAESRRTTRCSESSGRRRLQS